MTRQPRRRPIPADVRRAVLIEAGYRCAVPTCRTILALDLHHLVPVASHGGNVASNLVALCPNCHRLYHRGEFDPEALRVWKAVLEALSHAFDQRAINDLLFLASPHAALLRVSSDGMLLVGGLIYAGLIYYEGVFGSPQADNIRLKLTDKGRRFVDAWIRGDKSGITDALTSLKAQR